MSTTKTAISLDARLCERVDAEAEREGTTRSGFIAKAIIDYLRRIEDRRRVADINAAYADDEENEEDLRFLERMHKRNAHVLDPW